MVRGSAAMSLLSEENRRSAAVADALLLTHRRHASRTNNTISPCPMMPELFLSFGLQ